MKRSDAQYGFRVLGAVYEPRRLIDSAVAFAAHCAADPKAEPDRECYLSAFDFPEEFRIHMTSCSTPKGYAGRCSSPYLWFDIDRSSPSEALAATRRLVGYLLTRYTWFDDDDFLCFYSGGKGYHLGVPLTNAPPPSGVFHRICRALAERLAEGAGVTIDSTVYDRVRLFRAPNSRHPKSGRYKRRLTHQELMRLSAERIAELANEPFGCDPPSPDANPSQLEADWRDAEAVVTARRTGGARNELASTVRLNRDTLEFVRSGADEGERTTRLFRAAANLREFAAPDVLVTALLSEAALDCGLPPAEVTRVIRCGIEHADRRLTEQGGAG